MSLLPQYERNNYKQNLIDIRMEMKRGQVTLFVIIALVLVLIIVALIAYPKVLPSITGPAASDPKAYLSSCLEPTVRTVLETIAARGGFMNPEGTLAYQGKQIKYLCYTSEYYKTCTVQEPLIKERAEQELTAALQEKAAACVKSFAEDSKRRGSDVSTSHTAVSASLLPGKLVVALDSPLTVTQDISRTYTHFTLEYGSEMYDLLLIASSIVSYEATYGDSEITTYLQYYPSLKIEKTQLSDGTTIYIVSNVVSKESFAFASRSVPWPPGYPET